MKKLIIWITILLIILFPKIFFNRESFFFADNYSLLVPGKIFLVNQLKKGVIPFWNPFIFSGLPFFADISQSLFYPSTLLFLIFPPSTALNLNILLHLFISSLGIYWISRNYLSSTIWLLSSPLLIAINNIAALQSLTWMPWIVGLFIKIDQKRAYPLLLPLVISLSFLGGHPQPLIEAIILGVSIYLFANHQSFVTKIKYLLRLSLTCSLLLFFVILPFVELTSLSTRSNMKISDSLNSSTHPLHYLDFIFPNFFSNPNIGMVWGINWNFPAKHGVFITYLGLISLVYLTINIRKLNRVHQIILVTGLLSLFIALGKYLPGFSFIYSHLPGISWFRNLSLILYLFVFTSSILIPKGIKMLILKPSYFIAVGSTLAAILFLSIDLWFNQLPLYKSAFHTYYRDYLIVWNSLFYLSFSSIIFWLTTKFQTLIIPFTAINLILVVKPFIFTAPSQIYQTPSIYPSSQLNLNNFYRVLPSDDYLAYTGLSVYWSNMLIKPPFGETRYTTTEQQTYHDLITRQTSLSPNWNMVHQIPSIFGYATFIPKATAKFWQTNPHNSNVNRTDPVSFNDFRLSDQGVKYFIVDKHIFNHQIPQQLTSYPIMQDTPDRSVIENIGALPYIRSKSNQFHIYPANSNVNQIVFQTSGKADDVFVNISPYPGWTCQMDNNPCTLITEKLGYKTSVPTGFHQFQLSFVPSYWPQIFIISSISWSVYLFILAKHLYVKNRH